MKEETMSTTAKKLKVSAQGDRDVVITREFDAPRKNVWRAYTEPELIKRWMTGPPGWIVAVCDIDLKVGGRYRWVWKSVKDGMDGAQMEAGGVYMEINAPAKLVSSESFIPAWYPEEMVGTVELEERGGRTFLTQTLRYASREAREMVINSPMEQGLAYSYDSLESLLGTLG
jgi:uncharacterized protein YndB with AHSA1/START domain